MMQWPVEWFHAISSLRMVAWRGVESQYAVATTRLVDSWDEEALLEDMLEASKPPVEKGQHYLLFTPFRYSPIHAHRFRLANTKGQWYGAATPRGVCAELAYWRYRFLLDSASLVNQEILTDYTFYRADINGLAVDLMSQPWVLGKDLWVHGSDYSATQLLAQEAASRGVQWIAYESVREPGERCAVVLDQSALSEPEGGIDKTRQTWRCKATRTKVMISNENQRFEWSF